ncbi:MAG: polysaccharide pyruvyl transferase family protein [Lachnospiraceae bacterium]|nr:polysaccharide pyruvyl transferase family protein [Lachnospiraceae bacterium]
MRTLAAFGIGANFYSLVERLDAVCEIAVFSDNDSGKWGQHILGDQRICMEPRRLRELESPFVLIMAERESSIKAIEEQCDEYGLPHQRVYDFLQEIELKPVKCQWPQSIQRRRIHKFIELLVHGTTECNFHCEYCYVWRKHEFTPGSITSEYTAKEIREALSQAKLGGPCHINACALGETLLSKDIVELTYELLDEGHYLSIITNGTITPRIDAILQFPDELLERMFFKLSFHYAELKRTKLSDVFWKNADKIKNSPCSYSIEITPCDNLIDEIDNIKKEFAVHAGSAMPHITFTRDTNKEGLDLLSELSLEEYKNVWQTFDSDLFNLKCDLYKKKIHQTCYAGSWSYRVNVVNGNLQSCYQQELVGTVFDEGQKVLPVMPVGHGCRLDYCFNNHAFLAWGDAPEIVCDNYFKVRDRRAEDSTHWVKGTYAAAMQQKLYDNNFAYINRWSDYDKLFAADRKPAFILFNSPDYSNLGDHAIALAERELFRRLFPDIEFIEISCQQYIRENLLIQNVIQDEDILIISGGGYLGSLWLWLEDITKNIIQQYPENKIIIFPQTMYFEDSGLGESEKKSLSSVLNFHTDLTIMLRDKASYRLASELLDNSVRKILTPDIALSLKYEGSFERSGGLVCIRDDKEAMGIDETRITRILQEKGIEAKRFTTISTVDVFLDNREEYVMALLDKIRQASVVITDRLHAMIFCAVTDTPCVAFDNLSGKVSESYQWIKENPHIVLCKKEEDFEICLRQAMSVENDAVLPINDIKDKFKELDEYLKETCFI